MRTITMSGDVTLTLVLVVCGCLLLSGRVHGSTYTHADALNLYKIWRTVDNLIPVIRPTDKITVLVQLHVLSLNVLDVSDEIFSTNGFLVLSWEDPEHAWSGNPDYMFLKQDTLWKPELVIDNAVSSPGVIADDELLLRIRPNGTVTWAPHVTSAVSCDVDVTYFPWDKQTCSIGVTSWMYDKSILNLTHGASHVNMDEYQKHGEWNLLSTGLETYEKNGTIDDMSHDHLKFVFNWQRRTGYYSATILLPIILTSHLGLIVFLLPVQSGEKVSFSLVVLLAVTVLMTTVTGTIPTTSKTTSILGVYMAAIMTMNSLEVLLVVCILHIHHKHDLDLPVSTSTQRFTRLILARLACFTCCQTTKVQDAQDDLNDLSASQDSRWTRRMSMPKNIRVRPSSVVSRPGSWDDPSITTENNVIRDTANVNLRTDSDSGMGSNSVYDTLDVPDDQVKKFTWVQIAAMLDWLSFCFMTVLICSTSIAFLVVLSNG